MSDKGKKKGGRTGRRSSAERARALLHQAREHDDGQRRVSLAEQALRCDPESREALLLLGDEAHDGVMRADFYRRALDSAQRALDAQVPSELDAGLGSIEAERMHARHRLGHALEELGLLREAATHYREVLRQDPSDPLAARYRLVSVLLELDFMGGDGHTRAELAALQLRFQNDRSGRWAYDRALFAFRQEGDGATAQAHLEAALEKNSLIVSLLIAPPAVASVAPSSSEECEAYDYAWERRELWQASPGAVPWLAESTGVLLAPKEETSAQFSAPDELRLLDEVLARFEPDVAARLSPAESEVLALLEEGIDALHPALKRYACALWVAFAHSGQPRIRKPAVHAAAIEYITAQLLDSPQITQKELAQRYEVGVSSVSRAAQAVDSWLDATLVDGLDVHGDELVEELAEELVDQLAGELVVELDEVTVDELRALPPTEEEWQGALRRAPFQVLEPRPHRPMLAMWYEQQGGSIVGQEIFGSTAPPRGLFHALVQAMFSPLSGEPRRPRVLRVEDAEVAEELQREFGPAGIEVRHGELEGITTLMASLEQFMVQHSALSYLEEGVEQGVVERFFHATARLQRASPWSSIHAAHVLGVDLEPWGEGQLCVSVIGNRGDERGLLIFHELDEYLRYFRHAELSAEDGALVGAPVEMLSVVYEAGSELDIRQRREVFKYGWEVVGAENYPMLYRFDADGSIQPLEADDYRVAAICSEAVAAFFDAHPEVSTSGEPWREWVKLEHCDTLERVCVSAPLAPER
ncbi:MAG: tetratricopeptide repeat protein [Deltaproteobacteria bacterium]|nr:tetratricopeptide repeat protein [Deltaproteobacteria bacterium]